MTENQAAYVASHNLVHFRTIGPVTAVIVDGGRSPGITGRFASRIHALAAWLVSRGDLPAEARSIEDWGMNLVSHMSLRDDDINNWFAEMGVLVNIYEDTASVVVVRT